MSLKKRYKESFGYIVRCKNYIFLVIGLFIFSGIFGAVFHSDLVFLNQLIKEIVYSTEGLNTIQLIVYIFFNNLRVALYGMLGGLILGLFPLFNALTNGVVLGYVFQRVGEKASILEFWRILPHGIFELPAVFISLGIGLRLGMFLFERNKKKAFVNGVRNAFQAFLLIVIPLLVIAAIIEGILIGVTG